MISMKRKVKNLQYQQSINYSHRGGVQSTNKKLQAFSKAESKQKVFDLEKGIGDSIGAEQDYQADASADDLV